MKDGFHLWSERYDREVRDVFALQDELTATIVEQLEVKLGPTQRSTPLVKRGTDDFDAYHLYLKGRYFWERRDLQKALGFFEEAVALDPGYALPYAGLADGYTLLGYYGFLPAPIARVKATEAAARAVVADDSLPEAHLSRGSATWFFDYDVRAVEASLLRACPWTRARPWHTRSWRTSTGSWAGAMT